MIRTVTRGEDATRSLGCRLAQVLEEGDVVLLVGGLGTGKTTFVKGLAEGLGCAEEVTSPTFTICHTYSGRLDVVHADLWRLERVNEIRDLALEEALEGGAVLVAEWGEAAEPMFGAEALVVRFSEGDSEDSREVEIDPSPIFEGRLGALEAAVGVGASG